MPIQHVDRLAAELHAAGVLNVDTKISDILKIAGVGELTPGSAVASGAVAWDGYVVVYKGLPAGLEEMRTIARKGEQIG